MTGHHFMLPVLLAVGMAACGGRSSSLPDDAGPATDAADAAGSDKAVGDLTPDGPPSLPWMSTYAGTVCNVSATKDGHRLTTPVRTPMAVAVSPSGVLYAADNGRLFKVENDRVVTIAGGYDTTGHKDGPLSTAKFTVIVSLTFAPDGTLYVAQTSTVRQVKDGMVTTLAGHWEQGKDRYVDGPAKDARFFSVFDIVVESSGAVLVGEANHIRRIKDGQVTTVAGKSCEGRIPYPDGPAATACFSGVGSVLPESDGGILFSESHRLRRVKDDMVTTLAGGQYYAENVDGPLATARFFGIGSLVRFSDTLYWIDPNKHLVRKLHNNTVTTLNAPSQTAGLKNGPLDRALLNRPVSVAANPRGDLFIADRTNCQIRRVQFK